jgi:hypothetical protein
MKHTIVVSLIALFTPVFAFAADPSLFNVIDVAGGLLLIAVQVIGSLALLYFFWGLAQYILSAGDEKKKEEGRNIMIWGTIALFTMVSVWGLARVLQDTFDLDATETLGTPQVQVQ